MTDFRMTPEAERVVTVHGCPQGCVDQVAALQPVQEKGEK